MNPRTTLSDFLRKLAALLAGGVPFADALDSFGGAPLAEPYREIPAACAAGLREGRSFSSCLAERSSLFHPLLVQFVRAAERQGNLDEALETLADRVMEGLFDGADVDSDQSATVSAAEPAGLARLMELLRRAIERRASDVHIESTDSGGRIRLRIDGMLTALEDMTATETKQLVAAAKLLFECDPAEHKLPQDGRARITVDGTTHAMRLCTARYVSGEMASIRIINAWSLDDIPSLDSIFVRDNLRQQVLEAINRPHGLVVVSGPVGSGKTTTMYSLLNHLRREELKVFSAEDPIELVLPGVHQMAIDHSIGLTFKKALATFLRSDPDIICAAEIRDYDTAAIVLQAALAGHRAITALHGTDSVNSLLRLLNVGLEPYLVSDGLVAIIAQRLVRRLCPACKVPYWEVGDERADLPRSLVQTHEALTGSTLMVPVGCEQCSNGFAGRLALFEFLPMTHRLTKALSGNASYASLLEAAQADGFETLVDDCVHALKNGLTSACEFQRVVASQTKPQW